MSDVPSREEILQSIEDVAKTHLDLPALATGSDAPPRLGADLRLVEDLALDSIQLLTLAVEVENRFRICLDPEDEAGIETVGDLADVVAAKLKGGGGDG